MNQLLDAPAVLDDRPQRPRARFTAGDRAFRTLATATASICLLIVIVALVFLIRESRPALESAGTWEFITTSVWNPTVGAFGVGGVLLGTVIIATISMVVSVPIALGMAIFINEYSPAGIQRFLTSTIDLLAALPSLLFGLWGFAALQSELVAPGRWLAEHMSALPFFELSSQEVSLTQSSFVAGVVVSMMVIPIITSVSRDVMAQVPREQCEGALALGGTRWGMVRTVVLPFGKSGIVGATLLGFGRALGETIVVAVIISLVFKPNFHILERGAGSVAALIATKFGESGALERSALCAAGLALFIVTLCVSLAARRIVNRAAGRA